MKHSPYAYKGCEVTIQTEQVRTFKWRWSAITIQSKTTWSVSQHYLDAFDSEPEAYNAAKKIAEERIDNQLGELSH
jgi:hypothetical protein